MPTEIPLTQGKVAIVDNCDSDLLQFKWYFHKMGKKIGYAARHTSRLRRQTTFLHKVIAARKGLKGEIDHHDQNTLNNRRNNLRPCTRSQNGANSKMQINNKSGFQGVCWANDRNKWQAYIKVRGKQKHLGHFPGTRAGKIAAARTYNKAAIKYFGEFAFQNKI